MVLHPHPEMAGDASHPFVVEVAKRLTALGLQVATPDLRDPDIATSATALRAVAESIDADGCILVGYSWGSVVVSHAAPTALAARVLVAPPVSLGAGVAVVDVPTLVLVPEHDQFGDIDVTRAAYGGQELATVEEVRGADHFLWGSIDVIADRIAQWAGELA